MLGLLFAVTDSGYVKFYWLDRALVDIAWHNFGKYDYRSFNFTVQLF
jgi:hypothetical protein